MTSQSAFVFLDETSGPLADTVSGPGRTSGAKKGFSWAIYQLMQLQVHFKAKTGQAQLEKPLTFSANNMNGRALANQKKGQ